MNEKIAGYILLVSGILVIAFAAWSVFSVFTKKSTPVQLFSFSGISLDASKLTGGAVPQSKDSQMELIPSSLLNDTSNIFAHLFLMGFIAGIGHKIASLGVMLLRPVEVKVRTKETPVNQ